MHRILERQLQKHLGLKPDAIPPELAEFVTAIDRTYTESDTNMALQDNSMKFASEELVVQNAELAREKERAEQATKLKDQFVSLVAHDLKSPFNSILGFLKLVLGDKKTPLAGEHRQLVERAVRSSEGLVRMINELLDITRLQTGKVTLNRKFMDPAFIAGAVAETNEFAAEEKGLKIMSDVRPGSRIYCDMDLFREVVQNLVSNAVKFCKEGDSIRIHMPEPGIVAVTDTGPGINEKLITNIFRHEVKTSTTGSRGESGTGLGLPYSYDIMQTHGGSLAVESAPGKGATFLASLPVIVPRMLLVDDDLFLRETVKLALASLNIEIVEASDGDEALPIINAGGIHIVLTDLQMGRMSGFELLKRIREAHNQTQLPVIVITGDYLLETREQAFRLGANDFVNKPIERGDLLPRIKRFTA